MKKPIRIAFDASPMLVNRTGIANYIEQLACALADTYPRDAQLTGFYYNFLGRRSASHLPTRPNLSYRPVTVIPSKVVYQLRRWGIELPVEILAKSKSDFLLFGNFLGYPSLFGTPAASVVHDLTYLDLPEYVAAKNRSDLTRFVPKQIKRSAFTVTVSEFSKQKIAHTYQVDPAQVLVTPIPPSPPLTLDNALVEQTLAKLAITKPYLLFVGTIEPRKNVLALVDAFLQLPEAVRTQHQLVIAGRMGWHCEQEKTRLAQLHDDPSSGIRYLGFIDDETRGVLYSRATLFATASHYEGFGMPVLEAMSYSLPCAVSDIPVFHEVAENNALYFDHTSVKNIAQTLEHALTDQKLLQELATRGKQQAGKYQWQDIAVALMERIKRTIDEEQ